VNCRPIALLAVAACAVTASAATLERLSLDEMIVQSSSVVRGKVSETWTAFSGSSIYTHYRVQVSERFKGPVLKSVDVVVPGGTVGNLHQNISGSPVLKVGEEFVFFLWTSSKGVTWITGLTQGLFSIDSAGSADPIVYRAATRELMLDRSTARPVKDSAVSMRLTDLRGRIAARVAKGAGQ
jgi:hypothetical protein